MSTEKATFLRTTRSESYRIDYFDIRSIRIGEVYVAITRAKKGVFIFSNRRKVSPFAIELAKIDRVKSISLIPERHNPCTECDTGEIVRKAGKFGVFYGCSNYPDCEFTKPVECPKCSSGKLVKRESKHGPFLSCSTFPKCKHSESIDHKK